MAVADVVRAGLALLELVLEAPAVAFDRSLRETLVAPAPAAEGWVDSVPGQHPVGPDAAHRRRPTRLRMEQVLPERRRSQADRLLVREHFEQEFLPLLPGEGLRMHQLTHCRRYRWHWHCTTPCRCTSGGSIHAGAADHSCPPADGDVHDRG